MCVCTLEGKLDGGIVKTNSHSDGKDNNEKKTKIRAFLDRLNISCLLTLMSLFTTTDDYYDCIANKNDIWNGANLDRRTNQVDNFCHFCISYICMYLNMKAMICMYAFVHMCMYVCTSLVT